MKEYDKFDIIEKFAGEIKQHDIHVSALRETVARKDRENENLKSNLSKHKIVLEIKNNTLSKLREEPKALNTQLNAIETICDETNIDKMTELTTAPAKVGHLVRAYNMVRRSSGEHMNKAVAGKDAEIARLTSVVVAREAETKSYRQLYHALKSEIFKGESNPDEATHGMVMSRLKLVLENDEISCKKCLHDGRNRDELVKKLDGYLAEAYAKASKLNAEKLMFMRMVKMRLNGRPTWREAYQLIMADYKAWQKKLAAKRKGKVTG